VVAAAWLFLAGHLLAGVICAWLMTLGDTVDGKLARVTLRSSKFGDKLDHLTDLIHPPFWYLAWWWGALTITGQVWHQATGLLAALIVVLAGYVIGRALEIAGKKAAGFNIFIWRPFDAAFRAVVARRNPNLLLMTASLAVGRPDLGLIAVAVWTIISLGIQVAQLVSLRKARAQGERIASFLDAPPAEEAESSRAAAAA